MCLCIKEEPHCEEGRHLFAQKQKAWDAWCQVSGTPRGEDGGFREDYYEAKAAYLAHIQQRDEGEQTT